ncbi:MAG: hypothetical protein HOW97_09590 [Catenulispora sp.]|nr:hypothetical protein [Catenulispora sp.]
MRLYTRTGASALDHPEYGHFDADENGGFDFPDPLSDELHRFHAGGRPMWETDVERQNRLLAEEMERRRDPATLMDAVQQLVNAARTVSEPASAKPPAETKPPVKRTTKRAATHPAE